jgi:hypothetical protein
MNERAEVFLDHWCSHNIKSLDCVHREKQAKRYVVLCLKEAERIGIPERDVREAADGDLIGYVLREMEAVEKEARGD